MSARVPTPPDACRHIDAASLLDAVGGDATVFVTLGRMFLDSTPTAAAAIVAAAAARDGARLRAQCHQLRSSAVIVGAHGLNAALGDIEQQLRQGGDIPPGERIAALSALIAAVMDEMRGAIAWYDEARDA